MEKLTEPTFDIHVMLSHNGKYLSSRNNWFMSVYPTFYKSLQKKYPNTKLISELLYLWYNKIDEVPVCKVCGCPVRFNGFAKGYSTYCSSYCANQDEDTKQTQRDKFYERYLKKFDNINLHNRND